MIAFKTNWALVSLTLFAGIASDPAFAVTVGDPKNPAKLAAAVYSAYQAGAHNLTIQPGTYVFPAAGSDTFRFENWHDLTLCASNVTFVFEELKARPIHFLHCTNVTFAGARLRFISHAFSQGRIKTVGTNATGNFCEWQIDAGYPNDEKKLGDTLNLIDQNTRRIKAGTADVGYLKRASIGTNLFRLDFGRQEIPWSVGDWFVCRYPGGSTFIHLDGSENIILQDITCQNGGFANFFETGGSSNHLVRCQITYGTKPAGADEPPLVSCGADGFHSVGAAIGPEIRDCTFEGVFLDDCIAIHGSFQDVLSVSNRTLIFGKGYGGFAVGDPVRISGTNGFFAEARCVTLRHLETSDQQIEVTLDRSLDVPVGAKGNNPNRCGRGFKIINTRLGDTRSRGILVKADDGLIENCVIEGCTMSGVSIGPEYWWNEANYAWHVVVSNNIFRDCNKHGTEHGSIFVHGDGAIGNHDIVIKNNLIESGPCRYVFNLEWVDGIEISSNSFINAAQSAPKNRPALIWLQHARNISLLHNTIKNLGTYSGDLLRQGADVSGITNNDANGIKATTH
jgi:hypothetical protein